MGGMVDAETLIEELTEALDRYREREKAGDDMADAGRELAETVEDRLSPRPCSVNRTSVIEMIRANRHPDDLRDMREVVLMDDPDGEKIRRVLDFIDQRITELETPGRDPADTDIPPDPEPAPKKRPGKNPFLTE
jgi:hypothetical protein